MGFYMYGVLYKTRTNFKTSDSSSSRATGRRFTEKQQSCIFVCLSLPLSAGGLRALGIIYSVDYSAYFGLSL